MSLQHLTTNSTGTRLAAAGSKRGVYWWDGNKKPRVFRTPTYVQALALSPDGLRVATLEGGVVRVWDPTSGEELLALRCEGSEWWPALAFTPDGNGLAVATQAVRIWNGTPLK